MAIPRPSRPTGCASLSWSTWGQQWWAMLGAFSALIVLIILLDRFDGKPVFSWNGITLNTITSILSVTVKAATLFVIGECMAQWKWILFAREQRPLIDFDRLDGATRGPMGSLRLLLKTKGAFVAQFGAMLTLVALALDPFAQQLVQLREDTRFEIVANGSRALVPKAYSYSSGESRLEVTSSYVGWTNANGESKEWVGHKLGLNVTISATMGAAISSGFFKSLEDVRRERFVYCPTGKCKFPSFLTLGVCHKSRDITSKLAPSTADQDFNNTLGSFGKKVKLYPFFLQKEYDYASAFILPNGHFIGNVDGTDPVDCEDCPTYLATSFGTDNPNKTISMRDTDTLIWSMSFIYPDITAYNRSNLRGGGRDKKMVWPNIPMLASESALYYCIKNITASVVDNKLLEEETEVPGVTRTSDSWDAALRSENYVQATVPIEEVHSLTFDKDCSLEHYNDLRLQIPGYNATFSVTPTAVLGLSAHFQGLLRWADWHNSAEILGRLREVPGMAKAVGYNAATFGRLATYEKLQGAPSKTIVQLMSLESDGKFHEARVFEVMAASMTNEIRRSSLTGDLDRNRSDTTFVEGETGIQVVLYRVEWPWIGLHAAMLASTCLFMVLTIRSTGRNDKIPLWKSSSLGAIRRGHDIGDQLASAGDHIADMEAMARKLKVKAYRDDVDEASPTMGR